MNMTCDLVSNWEFLWDSWHNYATATSWVIRTIVAATLLSIMGNEFLHVCKNLPMTADERQDAHVILTKLSEYFTPKRIEIYERYVFNCRSQKTDDSALHTRRPMWVRRAWGRNAPRSYRHWLPRPWTLRTFSSRIYANSAKGYWHLSYQRNGGYSATLNRAIWYYSLHHLRSWETWSTREPTKKAMSHAPAQILW